MTAATAQAPVAAAAATAQARLLPYAPGRRVALAPRATLELVVPQKVVPVPGAAALGASLMAWQQQWLPLLDLHQLLLGRAGPQHAGPQHALVVAYLAPDGQAVRHGAIWAPELVSTVNVSDAQACALPDDHALWPRVTASCFLHEGQPVPVLSLVRLFEGGA